MSSPRRTSGHEGTSRRGVLVLLGSALLVGPTVSACRPLYGTTPGGASLKEVMAGVEVGTIPGRVGQRVRNELIFATTGGGYAADAKYRLDIAVRESVGSILVEQTGDAKGEMFYLDAEFKLTSLASNEVVFEGKSSARAAYDRYDPIFTNIRARIDAENRAASTVAEGIRTRVAAYLATTA
jgi:LPS-assembly lipoprotein